MNVQQCVIEAQQERERDDVDEAECVDVTGPHLVLLEGGLKSSSSSHATHRVHDVEGSEPVWIVGSITVSF